ncbi:SAM-dependent methyltransferase [Amycolatopsis sp. NPDC049688]|uniref:SAM-dependent methyltransferase n=1 Tax=Amycolatopsis sp. NPDC049688 TaxID=3154733 RepID=UPI0034370417
MIVPEVAGARQDRARLWNAMLGGGEAYEEDRVTLRKLREAAQDVERIAINEALFVERAWRFTIGLRGIGQVIYCGAPIPPGPPPHTAAREPIELGLLHSVVYVEPDPLLSAKGTGYLADDIAVVKRADPLDLADVETVLHTELVADEPVAVVAPSVLPWLGDGAARAWTRGLSALLPKGSYLIASHFLDPEMDSAVVLVERLLQRFDASGSLSGAFFRRQAAIEQLIDGWELVRPGVIPAQGWWPDGPVLREETPSDRLMAGVVARIPRPSP